MRRFAQSESVVEQLQLEVAHFGVHGRHGSLHASIVPLSAQMIQVLLLCPVDEEAQKPLDQVILVVIGALLLTAPAQVPAQPVCEAGALVAKVAVAVVLDGVVGAAEENRRHVRPGVLHPHLHDVEDPAFFDAPSCVSQQRVQLVDPPLTTLFSRSSRDMLRDNVPLARAKV